MSWKLEPENILRCGRVPHAKRGEYGNLQCFFIFGRFSIAGSLPKWPKIPFQYPLKFRHPKIVETSRKHHLILVSVRNHFCPPPAKADIATAILTNVIEHLVWLSPSNKHAFTAKAVWADFDPHFFSTVFSQSLDMFGRKHTWDWLVHACDFGYFGTRSSPETSGSVCWVHWKEPLAPVSSAPLAGLSALEHGEPATETTSTLLSMTWHQSGSMI